MVKKINVRLYDLVYIIIFQIFNNSYQQIQIFFYHKVHFIPLCLYDFYFISNIVRFNSYKTITSMNKKKRVFKSFTYMLLYKLSLYIFRISHFSLYRISDYSEFFKSIFRTVYLCLYS